MHFRKPEVNVKQAQELTQSERANLFWQANDESWHSPKTISAVIDLSLNTLNNWRVMGKGPDYVRSGPLVYYKKCDVLRWFSSFQPSRIQAE